MKSQNILIDLRRSTGLSIAKFAEKCGVSKNTIVNSEKRGIKSVKVAKKISETTGVSVNDLI